MEAVPRLPMISFDLKTSPEKTSFQAKLKDYIRYNYNEDAESFSSQIFQMEGLRASAVRPALDVAGCNTMKRYYCQLHFLLSRFPLGKDGEAAVKFSWKDPYTDVVVSAADITLEMASILYNIGALHCQLGAAENRTNPEGMKMACSHFQCAAWAFQHIREEFPQILNYDASTDLLLFMNQVCLAQAQECLLEKSMMDNRKASIVAKVAIQTVEYYKISLKLLSANSSDDASISETVSSKLCKKWEKYLKFKISYHGCIDMLYRGQQAEEEQKMGERVAYYEAAFEKLEEARKLSKGLDNIEAVNEALQFTQDVVEGKKKAATNENEFIYHENVPAANLLPEMKGASLVKGIGFNVNDPEVSGSDIFGRLIPLTAHETASIYSEELAKLLRKTTSTILKREEELDNFLGTLQLDELKAREEWKLPQDLIDRCAAISAKPDAIEKLIESMNSLSDTYQDVEGMLSEIKALLQKEEKAVQDYEEVVGKQPPSIAATDLTREANKYQDAHAKASESNQTLHKAMLLHIENLRLLSLPPRELREQIPAIAYDSPDDESVMNEMQSLMNKVQEMKTQRGMLIGQFREAINNDDITHLVVTFTGENKEQLFQQELQKHQKQVNLIKQNLCAQDKILAAVQEVYPKYSYARRNVGDKLQRRDAMVASLKASYDAYEDLLAKSNKGLEFYSKLQTNVSKLYQRVKSTCKVLEEEREQILKKILQDVPKGFGPRSKRGKSTDNSETTPLMPAESLGRETSPPDYRSLPASRPSYTPSGGGTGLKLKDYLNMKKETGKMSLVSGTLANEGVYRSAGYVPAPSPHVYETPVVPSWVPSVRPAPVGSEENDTPAPRMMDSDAAWNNPQWAGATQKGANFMNYPTAVTNSQAYPSAGNDAYARGYTYPDQNYSYQAQGYPSYPQPGAFASSTYGGYPTSSATNPATVSQINTTSSVTSVGGQVSAQRAAQAPGQIPSLPYASSQIGGYVSSGSVDPATAYQASVTYPGYISSSAADGSGLQYGNPAGYSPAYPVQGASGCNPQSTSYGVPVVSQAAHPESQPTTAVYNQSVSYDQHSSDGSMQTQRSSNTSLNSLGSLSSIKSQTSLTTAYSDPYVNEAAIKSHAATEFNNYSSNLNQQPHPYSNVSVPDGTTSVTYYPPGSYPVPVSSSTSGNYASGYSGSNYTQGTHANNTASTYSLGYTANNYTQSLNVKGGTGSYPSAATSDYQAPTNYNANAASYQQATAIDPAGVSTAGATAYQAPTNYNENTVGGAASYPQAAAIDRAGVSTAGATAYQAPTNYNGNTIGGAASYPQAAATDRTGVSTEGATAYQAPTNYNANTVVGATYPSVATVGPNGVSTAGSIAYQTPTYASTQNLPANNTGGYHPQYIPQMGGGYQQAAEYLQSGNSSTYTNTPHGSNFAMTPSGSYSTAPKTLNLKQDYQAVSSGNPHDSFIPQGAGNTPIQSPATYQQAGFAAHSSVTNTTSSTGDSKSSHQVNSSNVDLLAGLDFDVQQTPLIPENPKKGIDSPKKLEPAVAPTITPEPVQDKRETAAANREPEEKKMDVEALKAFVPEVEKFEKFVEGLTVKTLNGPTPLEVKWKEISDLQERDTNARSISVARCYPMKNRYPDILPYDDSRVELPSTKDDYINASLLKRVTHGMSSLILTQAPLPVTYTDFWTMILEQQVEVIVCLLGDMELGDHIYWPNDKGREMELGKLRLVLQTCNVRPQWVERILSVTAVDTKVTRVVVHLQFTAWPGSSFPASPAPFLTFVAEARTYFLQQRSPNHPAVVHCHSGVGRTGLFCLILAAILDVGAGRGIPDLVTYTAHISRVRKNSLRDREHLRFAYQSVLYFCQDLLLKRGILTNKTTFDEKKKKEGKTHTRHPSEDFLVPSNIEQLESKLHNMEIEGKSKEGVDVSRGSSKASSGRTSPIQPLLAAMDPNAFNLKDNKPVRAKPKFTPDSFTKPSVSLSNAGAGAQDDPLSSLDPLWSLKK